MTEAIERLRRYSTRSQRVALVAVLRHLGGAMEGTVIVKALAEEAGVGNSNFSEMLRNAAIAGVLEADALGATGLYIRVLDPALYEAFAAEVGA